MELYKKLELLNENSPEKFGNRPFIVFESTDSIEYELDNIQHILVRESTPSIGLLFAKNTATNKTECIGLTLSQKSTQTGLDNFVDMINRALGDI